MTHSSFLGISASSTGESSSFSFSKSQGNILFTKRVTQFLNEDARRIGRIRLLRRTRSTLSFIVARSGYPMYANGCCFSMSSSATTNASLAIALRSRPLKASLLLNSFLSRTDFHFRYFAFSVMSVRA